LIKDHQHTIKNFGFPGAMNSLYHAIKDKDHEEALAEYFHVETLGLLRDFATDVLYNFDRSPDGLLLVKKGYNTVTKLLNLIHESTRNQQKERIIYLPEIEQHPLNKISDKDVANYFTVFLNLYSNAVNYDRLNFSIEVALISKNRLKVSFRNEGQIAEEHKEYFNNNSFEPVGTGKGLTFIKNALREIGHVTRKCEAAGGWTTINLTIYEPKTDINH
jgi:hypothetical protein